MFVIVSYDVSTVTPAGRRRLARVARICKNFGQRAQNSVFECKVDPAHLVELKAQLLAIVDLQTDSLRFYFLGASWQRRVEHFGAKPTVDPDEPMIV